MHLSALTATVAPGSCVDPGAASAQHGARRPRPAPWMLRGTARS